MLSCMSLALWTILRLLVLWLWRTYISSFFSFSQEGYKHYGLATPWRRPKVNTFEINLEVSETDVEKLVMKLFAYLRANIFFLFLNDMCTTFDLEKLGHVLTMTEREKFIFSTRNRDLFEETKSEQSMKIKPFSTDEGWDLFSKVDFKEAKRCHVPKHIECISKQFSSERKGFPSP